MPKRSRKTPRQSQSLSTAGASGEEEEPPSDEVRAAARALGSLGGKKGGPARARKLTAEQRSEIARRAAQKRWRKV
ncbi:MAG: histone H1 [Chloroflexi bacterium]|nr:MAG: histone H1 [Chloroflexota bacterium]